MSSPEEDEAWRSIVEHYGERPTVDEPSPGPDGTGPVSSRDARPDSPAPFEAALDDDEPEERPSFLDDPGDRFVPPPPPPLPRIRPLRLAAWGGVLGAPVVLVLLAMLSVSPPVLVPLLLAVAFVGGFLYLVATMDRGPRDPWDDGAQV